MKEEGRESRGGANFNPRVQAGLAALGIAHVQRPEALIYRKRRTNYEPSKSSTTQASKDQN